MSNVTKPLFLDETGQRIADALETMAGGASSGLTSDIKAALLTCFSKVAWIDDDGQDYYDALELALYPPATLDHIGAVYTQSGVVYPNTSLNDLKTDLVVTAYYSNTSSETVTSYTLSGTLAVGTSTVTVSYGGKTTTFTVTVSEQSYVTSGLIHRYDAIQNTSNGHDSSSGVWEDLIGEYDLTITSTSAVTWGNDYLQFDGTSSSSAKSDADDVETPSSKTVEFVLSTTSADTETLGQMFYDQNAVNESYGKVTIYSDNSVGVQGKTANTYETGVNSISGIHSIVGVYANDGTTSAAYVNGELVSLSNSKSHSMSGSKNKMIVGGSAGATEQLGYLYTGKLHAIRIYNRNLTAEEIAQNYEIDVARFGLE